MDLEPALTTNSRTNEPSILMLSGESFCIQVSDEYPVPKSSRAILTPSSRRALDLRELVAIVYDRGLGNFNFETSSWQS